MTYDMLRHYAIILIFFRHYHAAIIAAITSRYWLLPCHWLFCLG